MACFDSASGLIQPVPNEHIEQHAVDVEHASGEFIAALVAIIHDVGRSSATTRTRRIGW
jgi:hypothetical protein